LKIKDRLLLGVIAGLGANIPKIIIGKTGLRLKTADLHGPQIAAGIFLPGHNLAQTTGKIVGYMADATIAGILGVVTVYGLSFTGKDHYLLKGAATGQALWQGGYGLLSSFGVTQVYTQRPKTVLNEFVSHTVYGIAAAAIAANLGDESLFSGKVPISASAAPAQGRQTHRSFPQDSALLEPEAADTTTV
jgi:hypothetical protein